MDFEKPARLRWLLSLSAIWMPVSKPRSPSAPMHLSVKVRRLSVWLNVYVQLPREFVQHDHLADVTRLADENGNLKSGAKRCPERRRKLGQLFQMIWRIKP